MDRSNARRRQKWRTDAAWRESRLVSSKKLNKLRGPVWWASKKRKVLERLGGAHCVRCGATDLRILEVNHIGGGGRLEPRSGLELYAEIRRGVRSSQGLNVLCRPCNSIDYIERRFPDLAGRIQVVWCPALPAVETRAVPALPGKK
ncbi:MAG: hypothetical protein IVW52_05085 [Acidimicrobiales bacterium]|nr:hypothetical protein [Acidimicrobiales bacterium]